MLQLSARAHRVQAALSGVSLKRWLPDRRLTETPYNRPMQNLLGEVDEAAKITIPQSGIDAEAGHLWITLRQPFLRRVESGTPNRPTRRCSTGSRKWRG